jgi:hypothetical protein
MIFVLGVVSADRSLNVEIYGRSNIWIVS